MSDFKKWCLEQHQKTNHFYDEILPYEFHLRIAASVAEEFFHLESTKKEILMDAIWGHDVLEDCRVTYNDLLSNGASSEVADIIYAVTNEKGKSRGERANEKYYEGIRSTKGASFVKLCDRIANVRFSKLTNSRMLELYRKEYDSFIKSLDVGSLHPIYPMVVHLRELLW
jgi:(p)ppGpp synthase/HD superfamily hydrolase